MLCQRFDQESMQLCYLAPQFIKHPFTFTFETLGAFGARALELVDALVAISCDKGGRAAARSRKYRRLGAAVQAGNAWRIIEAHSGAAWSPARGSRVGTR